MRKALIAIFRLPVCGFRSTTYQLRFLEQASLLTIAIVLIGPIGCIGGSSYQQNKAPATISDVATTQPSYWYAKPAAGLVVFDNFSTLFKTCENVSRDFGFKIDRVDYRTGVLTTEPLESAQAFEPWRPDVRTIADAKESTLASVRRTIRFDFERNVDESWQAAPRVLVERQTVQERRITSVALYRGAYTKETPKDAPQGSQEADEGFLIPPRYLYAIGRDTVLEAKIARTVSEQLSRKAGRKRPPATEADSQ